jgi:hypothetical protein
MQVSRRTCVLATVAIAAAVGLAGCGADDIRPASSGDPVSTSTTAAPSTTSSAPGSSTTTTAATAGG